MPYITLLIRDGPEADFLSTQTFQWLTHGKNRMYFLRHFRENNSAIFQTNLVS